MIDRRSLSQRDRAAIHLRQNGRCAICNIKLRVGQYEIDHIQALIHGGTNNTDNLRAICTDCHKDKTRSDVQAHKKVGRIQVGGRQRKGPPMLGSRNSPFKKHVDGSVTRR